MKRISVAILTLFICLSLQAEWLASGKGSGELPTWNEGTKTAQKLTYSVVVPGVQVTAGSGGFKLLTVPGGRFLQEGEGLPKLPVVHELLAIPNCSNVQVIVTPLNTTEYDNYKITPNGKMVNNDGMLTEVASDRWIAKYDSLKQTGNYPGRSYSANYPALRGQRMAELELYPVQYNAQTNKISVTSEYLIQFEFSGSDGVYSQNVGIFSGVADGNIRGFYGTGLTASVNTGKTGGSVRWLTSAAEGAGIDYLMIVADQQLLPAGLSAITALAEKRANYNGFNVGIIKKSLIPLSDPIWYRRILNFIKEVYSKGGAPRTYDGYLGYVCLIGDYQVYLPGSGLPPSYAYVGGEFIGEDENPAAIAQTAFGSQSASDFYYSCLTIDLFTGKEDDYGDIFVGRIPAGTAAELANYVNKVVAYEPLVTEEADGWRKKILMINGDIPVYPPSTPANHGSAYSNIINGLNNVFSGSPGLINYNITYTTNTFDSQTGLSAFLDNTITNLSWTPPYGHDATVTPVYTGLFNEKQWLVDYYDHGLLDGWISFSTNPADPWNIYNSSPPLNNGASTDGKCRLPFIMSNACETGQFDRNDNTHDSFAESMLLKNANGAIGIFANSRLGYSDDFTITPQRVYASIFSKHLYQSAEILLSAKNFHDTQIKRRYALFGDPALNIMFDQRLICLPDFAVKIKDREDLKFRYYTSYPCNVDLKVRISNFGQPDNHKPVSLIIFLDNDTQVIHEQNQIFIDQPLDLSITIPQIDEGYHKIIVKINVSDDVEEISTENNTDIIDIYIGKYQTGYPKKTEAVILQTADYDNDGKDDFITNIGVYNQNMAMIEPISANIELIGCGKLKKDTPYLLYKSLALDKLYLKTLGNSPIKELPIPDGHLVLDADFVNFNQSSNLQQILVLTRKSDVLPENTKNCFYLVNEDLELRKISQLDGKVIHKILGVMDFDNDGLTDILYCYNKTPIQYGMVMGNGANYNNINIGDIENADNNIVLDFNNDGLCDIILFRNKKPFICSGSISNGIPDFGNQIDLLNEVSSNFVRLSSSEGKNHLLCWSGNSLKSISGDNGYVVNSVLSGVVFENGYIPVLKMFKNNNKNLLLIYSYNNDTDYQYLSSAYILEVTEQNGIISTQQISKATFLSSVKANNISLTQTDNNLLGYSVLSKHFSGILPNNAIHLLKENIQLNNFVKDAVHLGNMRVMQLPNYLTQNRLSAFNYSLKGIWYINEPLTIPRGQTLTIAPNTKLLFAKGATLTIAGNLTINAPADKPVVFCSQLPNQQWEGIKGNGANSISLNNVIIRDAVTGVADFSSASIQNTKFYDCGLAMDFKEAGRINLSQSQIENCSSGISITKRSDDIEPDYSISNCSFKGVNISNRSSGIAILNVVNGTVLIENNFIRNFSFGINLSYGNSQVIGNSVSKCYMGLRAFESSPIIIRNDITINSYGICTYGYSAPVLNLYGSSISSGAKNAIHNNSERQILYDLNSSILLDYGRNDVFGNIGALLVDKPGFTGRTILARDNFWGSNFIRTQPQLFFNPANSFVFQPYAILPFVTTSNTGEIPADEELNTFDLALKKELGGNSESAYGLFQQALTEDSLETKAILPRLEYNSPESGKGRSDVISDLFTAGKINSFIFSSAKAREAVLNKNYTEASSFYLMKLDSADLHNDSLIAKVNLLDIIWQDQGKGAGKAAQLHSDLVCRTEKEYLGKREDLMAELSGEKTGISSENLITDFNLYQNYPNPFNPTTIIRYALPEPGDVKIRIYNIMGALVSELKEGVKNRGLHSTTFNGNKVSAGVYIYTLDYNGKTLITKKMIMVK